MSEKKAKGKPRKWRGQPEACERTASSLRCQLVNWFRSAGLCSRKKLTTAENIHCPDGLQSHSLYGLAIAQQFFHFHSFFPDARTFPLLFINMI